MEVSPYMIIYENVEWHLGEGDFKLFDEIPLSAIELPEGRIQTFPDISLPEKLTWNSRMKVKLIGQCFSDSKNRSHLAMTLHKI